MIYATAVPSPSDGMVDGTGGLKRRQYRHLDLAGKWVFAPAATVVHQYGQISELQDGGWGPIRTLRRSVNAFSAPWESLVSPALSSKWAPPAKEPEDVAANHTRETLEMPQSYLNRCE